MGRVVGRSDAVVVMGVTGSGKTTVGRLVAARRGVAFLDADDLHDPAAVARMRAGVALTEDDRRPWLLRCHHRLRAWADAGVGGVLACSALSAAARRLLIGDLGEVRFALLTGDVELLRRRLAGREGHFATEALLPSQLATLEVPPDAVTFDVTDAPEVVAGRIDVALAASGRPEASVRLPYASRRQAGQVLAGRLLAADPSIGPDAPGGRRAGVVVLGLLRGGVPVAAEVAQALGVGLGAMAVRKIGAPGQPELALGAVAGVGAAAVDRRMAARFGLSPGDVDAAIGRAVAEADEIRRRFADVVAPSSIGGRVIVLVDDGLATGATMRAAIGQARAGGAAEVVVAVPVGAADTCAVVGAEADRLLCPAVPAGFGAVGRWYRDFAQVPDAEVRALLVEHRG